MNIAVIGLGSMGKRRIRLLQGEFPNIRLIGIDGNEARKQEVKGNFRINTYSNLLEASSENLDAVIISTSPLSHEALIKEALGFGLHVFTEINLLNHYYEEVIADAEQKDLHLYLSSTFLHRKEIQYIQNAVSRDMRVTYRYHVGQYLPDWHPWESYKDFFVSNKSTNACREIFAIEMPWIIATFGNITDVSVNKSKISDLEIDYPDTYSVILKHKSGIHGTLNVNVVSRESKRELDIIGENTQLCWKGTPSSLEEWSNTSNKMESIELYESFTHQKEYAANIIEEAYLEEIKEFVGLVRGEVKQTKYSFKQDKIVIDWIDVFEEGIS